MANQHWLGITPHPPPPFSHPSMHTPILHWRCQEAPSSPVLSSDHAHANPPLALPRSSKPPLSLAALPPQQTHSFTIAASISTLHTPVHSLHASRFNEIPHSHKDAVDWTVIMGCFGHHGMLQSGLRLFVEMQSEDVKVDDVAWFACSMRVLGWAMLKLGRKDMVSQ
ncbi:hypothetical protein FF2_044584 [Malus domestica]